MYVFLKAFKGSVLVFANGRFKRDIKEERQPRNLNVELLLSALDWWGYCEARVG